MTRVLPRSTFNSQHSTVFQTAVRKQKIVVYSRERVGAKGELIDKLTDRQRQVMRAIYDITRERVGSMERAVLVEHSPLRGRRGRPADRPALHRPPSEESESPFRPVGRGRAEPWTAPPVPSVRCLLAQPSDAM